MSGEPIVIRSRRNRALDEVMDAYVEWRQECIRVWETYQRWRTAVRADAAIAFQVYRAALEGEERAAEVYGRHIGAFEARVRAASTKTTGNPASGPRASRQ
jgi:hypothetical protein